MKLKQGAPVVVTPSRTPVAIEGRFYRTRQEPSGMWVDVNIAPKGKPAVLKAFRPAQVQPA